MMAGRKQIIQESIPRRITPFFEFPHHPLHHIVIMNIDIFIRFIYYEEREVRPHRRAFYV